MKVYRLRYDNVWTYPKRKENDMNYIEQLEALNKLHLRWLEPDHEEEGYDEEQYEEENWNDDDDER